MSFHPMNKHSNLVTAANSILKRYKIEQFHPSLPGLDDALKMHTRIVFILFDGLSSEIIKRHAPRRSKLKTSPIIKLTSVIPATTVAATNAFLRGQYPAETGYLGWTQYFSDLDRRIEVFPNKDADTNERIKGPNIMEKRYGGKSVFDLVAAKYPTVRVKEVWPGFRPGGAKTEKAFFNQIDEELNIPGPKLMYCYWVEPDSMMHVRGTKSLRVKWQIRKMSKRLDDLTNKHEDTLFVILADHGMKNVKYYDISDNQPFFETLKFPFTLEGRCAMFHVKDGQHKKFEQLFAKHYGEHFRLFKTEELEDAQVFGYCPISENASVFFGDYLAIAKDDYSFYYSSDPKKKPLVGHHAGITPDEMNLQLTLINN